MTKDKDGLVEKVARAIARTTYDVEGFAKGTEDRFEAEDLVKTNWSDHEPEARAAIDAVLEWYSDPQNVTDEMVEAAEEANVDNVGRSAIAAALRAAAGSALEAKP